MNDNKILINGWFGANNAGDESILQSEIELFQRNGYKITVSAYNPEYVKKIHGVSAIPEHRQAPKKWKNEAKKSDHIVIGGGGLVESSNIVKKWLPVTLEAQKLKKPVHFLGVGVTPAVTKLHKFLYRETLNRSQSISVRDKQSKKLLHKYGVQRPINVKPDFVFYRKGSTLSVDSNINSNQLLIVLRDVPWLNVDIEGLAKVVETINDECACTVRVTQFSGKEKDKKLINDFISLLKDSSIETIESTNFNSLENEVSKSRFVIGMRLHSVVYAAKHGIPFVSIAYNPKCQNIPHFFGFPNVNWCTDIKVDEMINNIRYLWDDSEIRDDLRKNSRQMHNQVEDIIQCFSDYEQIDYNSVTNENVIQLVKKSIQIEAVIRNEIKMNRPPAPKSVVPSEAYNFTTEVESVNIQTSDNSGEN